MYPKRIEKLPWRDVEGRTVVIQPRKGEIHELNSIATLLWQKADGTHSVNDMAQSITENFDIEFDQAEQDIKEFFYTLEARGLVQLI